MSFRWITPPVTIAIVAVSLSSQAFAASSYQVNYNTTSTITEFSTCKTVKNLHASGQALFVPTNTGTEWSTFYNNPPPGVTVGSCPVISLVFDTSATSGVFATTQTYTFAAQGLGTADPTRIVAVAIAGWNNSATARTISGVTIGGVAATQAVVQEFTPSSGTARLKTSIWYASVPTGTTGDVAITWDGSSGLSYTVIAGIYSIYNPTSSTPHTTNSNTNTSGALTTTSGYASTGSVAVWADNEYGGNPAPTLIVTNGVADASNTAVINAPTEAVGHVTAAGNLTTTWSTTHSSPGGHAACTAEWR